jgi:hypothetical protein
MFYLLRKFLQKALKLKHSQQSHDKSASGASVKLCKQSQKDKNVTIIGKGTGYTKSPYDYVDGALHHDFSDEYKGSGNRLKD